MWQLKFQYEHSDCLYSKQINKLDLVMYGYPLNHYLDKKKFHINGIQILSGNQKNINKYIKYLKKLNNIKRIDIISNNTLLFQTIITENIPYYQNLYDSRLFYPLPIIHKKKESLERKHND